MANYALITILTVMIAALLLQIVQSYAAQTAARGLALKTVDTLNMVLVAVLVLLILRQVMPIAAGLAGGLALSSSGVVSRGATMGMRAGGGLAVWSALAAPAIARNVYGRARGAMNASGEQAKSGTRDRSPIQGG